MLHTARPLAALLLGLSLVLAHACAGETGVHDGSFPPPVGGNGPVDSGHADGGPDGGDAGPDAGQADAGPVDAGPCAGALNRPTLVTAKDECINVGTHPVPLLIDTSCNASLWLDSVLTCTGHLGGPLNAFTGACGPAAMPCASTSIPGTLHCLLPDAGAPCAIVLCDSSGDGGCGP